MIKSLYINNFALIDDLTINFGERLNILTGETGAGKSILIDAIDVVFGARAFKEQIRTGESKAVLELCVKLSPSFPKELLEENGIEPEENDTLIISKEISNSGTRSRINGVMVTQNYIQSLREHLIDIHSQHETYNYMQPKTHINLLDSYGDSRHQELLGIFKNIHCAYNKTRNELESAKSQVESKEQRVDFLKFQVDEIESARIENMNEYDNLVHERSVFLNAEALKELTFSSYTCLYGQDGSIIDILNGIENKLVKASDFDKNLSGLADSISSSSINLKDIADELRRYSDNLETDPETLAIVEERIDALDKLKRKYGPEIADVMNNLQSFRQELDEIEIKSEKIDELTRNLAVLEENLKRSSQDLSISRRNLAKSLSDLICRELVKLEMPKVQFEIKVEPVESINTNGIDEVEFMISPNPGEPLKPLSRIASGGEIARVMLAIKTVFAEADGVNTVIFDEIDTGISGRTSQAVGEELAGLALKHQVLCITHQPIIAAMADDYFYIEKVQHNETTKVIVSNLDGDNRVFALSKLASGSSEDHESLNFALKLLQQAKDYKQSLKFSNNIPNFIK